MCSRIAGCPLPSVFDLQFFSECKHHSRKLRPRQRRLPLSYKLWYPTFLMQQAVVLRQHQSSTLVSLLPRTCAAHIMHSTVNQCVLQAARPVACRFIIRVFPQVQPNENKKRLSVDIRDYSYPSKTSINLFLGVSLRQNWKISPLFGSH